MVQKPHITAMGLLEEPIQKILADDLSILEKGMLFKEVNRDVGFGVADVLLQDAEGRVVVVEIETEAAEAAVAQVSRLAAGYAAQNGILADSVLKIISVNISTRRLQKRAEELTLNSTG